MKNNVGMVEVTKHEVFRGQEPDKQVQHNLRYTNPL